MPFNPEDHSYERVGALVDRFQPLSPINRADLDIEADDIAAALTAINQRVVTVEDGYLFPTGNLVLNPAWSVNSVGYAGGPIALLNYGHNRWQARADGTTYTVADGTCTITAGALGQVIDGRSIVTGPYTISWSGTAVCTIDGVPVESGDAVDLVTGTDALIVFSGGDVFQPQLTAGAGAPPFRPRTHELEMVLCRLFVFIEVEEGIATSYIHPSVQVVLVWVVDGAVVGTPRVFIRREIQPLAEPRYQSLDGGWWEYVPASVGSIDPGDDSGDGGGGDTTIDQTARDAAMAAQQAVVDAQALWNAALNELEGELTTEITTLESTFTTELGDTINAAVTSQLAAFTNADLALAGRLDTIEASYLTTDSIDAYIEAEVSEQIIAAADPNGALAARIEAIEVSYATGAEIDAVEASLSNAQTARANADAALAAQITALDVAVGDDLASLNIAMNTKVDAAGAISAINSQVSVGTGGETTTLQQLAAVAQDASGAITGTYAVKLKGGQFALVLLEDGTTEIRMDADRLVLNGTVLEEHVAPEARAVLGHARRQTLISIPRPPTADLVINEVVVPVIAGKPVIIWATATIQSFTNNASGDYGILFKLWNQSGILRTTRFSPPMDGGFQGSNLPAVVIGSFTPSTTRNERIYLTGIRLDNGDYVASLQTSDLIAFEPRMMA